MSMSGGVALNQGIALLHPIARYKVMRQLKSLVSAVQFWNSYSHLTFSTHQFWSRYPLGSSPLTCAGVPCQKLSARGIARPLSGSIKFDA